MIHVLLPSCASLSFIGQLDEGIMRAMASLRQTILERLKKTAMVWLAVYPSVLVVISLTGDCMRDWPLPLRVLGATLMIVPLVTNVSEPAVRMAVGKMERQNRRRSVRPRL